MEFQIVQAFFMLGFVAMAAGALWFFMERNVLKPELRPVATYATVIAFVAAILYYVMKDVVQFPLGETSEPGAPGTVVLVVISSLAWFSIIYEIFRMDISNSPAHAQRAVKIMRLFVVIGWAIYPVATAIEQFLQIGGADVALAVSVAACIYVVADVVNKVGFGIVAIQAA